MTDEIALNKASAKAVRAQSLLDNELFNEALETLRSDLLKAWENTPPRDTDGRERCWNAIQQLGKLKGYFETVLRDGKMAQAELKALAESAERKNIFRIR